MDSVRSGPHCARLAPGRELAGCGVLVMAAQSLGALGGGSPGSYHSVGGCSVPLSLALRLGQQDGPTLCSQAGTGPIFHSQWKAIWASGTMY